MTSIWHFRGGNSPTRSLAMSETLEHNSIAVILYGQSGGSKRCHCDIYKRHQMGGCIYREVRMQFEKGYVSVARFASSATRITTIVLPRDTRTPPTTLIAKVLPREVQFCTSRFGY
jgi:hypothetical protein